MIDIVIAFAILVVYLTYPETKRITLEEVSIIFDGKDAVSNSILEKQQDGSVEIPGETMNKKGVVVERLEVATEM